MHRGNRSFPLLPNLPRLLGRALTHGPVPLVIAVMWDDSLCKHHLCLCHSSHIAHFTHPWDYWDLQPGGIQIQEEFITDKVIVQDSQGWSLWVLLERVLTLTDHTWLLGRTGWQEAVMVLDHLLFTLGEQSCEKGADTGRIKHNGWRSHKNNQIVNVLKLLKSMVIFWGLHLWNTWNL